MKSLKDFNYLLSLDRRYTKTESEIFRWMLRTESSFRSSLRKLSFKSISENGRLSAR